MFQQNRNNRCVEDVKNEVYARAFHAIKNHALSAVNRNAYTKIDHLDLLNRIEDIIKDAEVRAELEARVYLKDKPPYLSDTY